MRRAIWLIALPPVLATIGLAWVAAAEIGGTHPLSPGLPRTVAEAAVVGNLADAARRIEQGQSADDIQMIRARFIPGGRVVLATPLEAAVIARNLPMVQFLATRGRTFEASRPRLACLARDAGAPAEMTAYLDADRTQSCEPGQAVAAVLARP